MPDWEALVRHQLAGLALEPHERAEVIEELAAHLDEACQELRRQGMTEEEAVRRAVYQVENWNDLLKKIQTAKMKENVMSNRVAQLWIPWTLNIRAVDGNTRAAPEVRSQAMGRGVEGCPSRRSALHPLVAVVAARRRNGRFSFSPRRRLATRGVLFRRFPRPAISCIDFGRISC